MRISLLSFALLASCASTSIRDDVDRVEALTKVELPDAVTASDVELATSQDVADLLKQPMTADTAVRIALLNNRELRGTLRDLGVERGELVQAGLLPNPTVAFDIRDPGAPGLPLQQDYYVEYELTRALLTPLRTAVAKADLEAARYHVAGSVVAVSYRARIAFFALLAAEQRLRIVQRGLEALAAARDAAQALHDAGNIPLVDLASEIATYEDARARAAEL
ncbi:MAG TPA: TolC family protein, partial [Myxococcota bacterium]|nr:TolC family protein [Myxococcota bacterium]